MSRSPLLLVALVAACGSAQKDPAPAQNAPPPSAAPAASASAQAPAAEPPITALPTECDDKSAKYCTPPLRFVKKVCKEGNLWVALAMFQKGTPWVRAYLRRDTEPFNGLGGAASTDKLLFDEEVLVLNYHAAPKGEIQVSGVSASFDVIRWDGTCATLQQEELTTNAPPKMKNAPVRWRDLEQDLRDALNQDEGLASVSRKRKNECKGATIGGVTAACEKLDKQLSAAIVDYVRKGGKVPPPAKLPQ